MESIEAEVTTAKIRIGTFRIVEIRIPNAFVVDIGMGLMLVLHMEEWCMINNISLGPIELFAEIPLAKP
jgi:hypothetical protein